MSSGGHSRTSRAAMKWRGRQRGRARSGSSIGMSLQDELADIELAAKKWAETAPRLGFCTMCGAIVDEEKGRLHDEGCIPSAPERCQKGQRT